MNKYFPFLKVLSFGFFVIFLFNAALFAGSSKLSLIPNLEKQALVTEFQKNLVESSKLDYVDVPAPSYPKIAREKGWEGTVLLKVLVSENGSPSQVVVEKSAGYPALDHSALEAVKRWKFNPAYHENIPYPSLILVPVRFNLTDSE